MGIINDLISLKGRTALITGAGGKLGVFISKALAELRCDLILVDHPNIDLSPIRDSLVNEWNIHVQAYHCDLEQDNQRIDLINRVRDKYENLNILINNAAFVGSSEIEGWAVPFEHQSIETWNRALDVNLTAPFHLIQGLTPLLKITRGASVINIGSIYGEYGPDWRLYEGTGMSNPAAYGASKGGLMQLTRWLSTTLAPEIRVNAISPGGIFRNQPQDFVSRYVERTPLKRMGNEVDFCGAIVYLASDLSQYVSGQIIRVDGGWSAW